MIRTPAISALLAAVLLASCATQTKEQLAAVRAAGVSAGLVYKLERWRVLTPEDIIELKRRHVNDAVALRQLDRIGVDYVVDKDILRKLQKAGVSEAVVLEVIRAGMRFEEQFHPYYGRGAWGYPYDPYYYALGWPYPRHPYPEGPGVIRPGLHGGPGPIARHGGPGPGPRKVSPGPGPRGVRPAGRP